MLLAYIAVGWAVLYTFDNITPVNAFYLIAQTITTVKLHHSRNEIARTSPHDAPRTTSHHLALSSHS